MQNDISRVSFQPFLRWAGSKKSLLNNIKIHIPDNYNNYQEPFLGSGALFFSIVNSSQFCSLSDLNDRLINTYTQIKENVEGVIAYLKTYRNDEEFYYHIRNRIPANACEEAAQFIFLNRTCFNGLYRVNSNDEFNVPYGKRKNVDFITEQLLRQCSFALKNTKLKACDFIETLDDIEENDLVFIDPPYTTTHNENGFIEYNKKIFSWEDQIRLHDYVNSIIEKGAYFILTNAAHSSIEELYSDICLPFELERRSSIGGRNSYRGLVKEYLFTNTHTK